MSAGTLVLFPLWSVPAGKNDRGMTDVNDVTVGELPGLHRGAVDGGAVGGAEVVQDGGVAVEVDVDVAPGHRGVGQPERGVLAAADDIRAALQLIGAAGPVVDGQRRRHLLLR